MGERRNKENRRRKRRIYLTERRRRRRRGEEREGLMILGVEQNVERLSGTGQSQVPSRMTEISLFLLI